MPTEKQERIRAAADKARAERATMKEEKKARAEARFRARQDETYERQVKKEETKWASVEAEKRREAKRIAKIEAQRSAAPRPRSRTPPPRPLVVIVGRGDFLRLLGCEDTQTAIKAAYRRLALQNHPDKNPDPSAKETFQRIQAAYEALTGTE